MRKVWKSALTASREAPGPAGGCARWANGHRREPQGQNGFWHALIWPLTVNGRYDDAVVAARNKALTLNCAL
jgi:hypothetical protein